jgi:hypothetical protein
MVSVSYCCVTIDPMVRAQENLCLCSLCLGTLAFSLGSVAVTS